MIILIHVQLTVSSIEIASNEVSATEKDLRLDSAGLVSLCRGNPFDRNIDSELFADIGDGAVKMIGCAAN